MADTTFPPLGPVTLQQVIPSYLYAQYSDDDALQTFVAAQNYLTQQWVNDFNRLNLPVYSALSGSLLDWVGQGLYGIPRPVLSMASGGLGGMGPYDTIEYDTLAYNEGRMTGTGGATYFYVNDDQYKRIITWHTYRGDGWQYTTRWLKQRVHRFINGSNGTLAVNDNTYDVSISCQHGGISVTVDLADSEIGRVLQYAIFDGVLPLPLQLLFNVTLEVPTYVFGVGRLTLHASQIMTQNPVAPINGNAQVVVRAGQRVQTIQPGEANINGTGAANLGGALSYWNGFNWNDGSDWTEVWGILAQARATIPGAATVSVNTALGPRYWTASATLAGAVSVSADSVRVPRGTWLAAATIGGRGTLSIDPLAQLGGVASVSVRSTTIVYRPSITITARVTVSAHTP